MHCKICYDGKLSFFQYQACNQMAFCRKVDFTVIHGCMEKCFKTATFSISVYRALYIMGNATGITEKQTLGAERGLRHYLIQWFSVYFSVPPPVEYKTPTRSSGSVMHEF